MAPWFETVTDLDTDLDHGQDVLRRRRYGVIEVAGGRLVRIRLRPWPKLASWAGVALAGAGLAGRRRHGDRCLVFYNQPRRHDNFLVLKYVVSSADATFATFRRAVSVLDGIARIKRSDALLCDAANVRISDRLLARWGWQPHCPSRWHRHFIKRFYGVYPPPAFPDAPAGGDPAWSAPLETLGR